MKKSLFFRQRNLKQKYIIYLYFFFDISFLWLSVLFPSFIHSHGEMYVVEWLN